MFSIHLCAEAACSLRTQMRMQPPHTNEWCGGGAAPPRVRSHAQSQKKKRRGPGAVWPGPALVGPGPAPPPPGTHPPLPPHRDRPAFGALGALGSTEAVAQIGVLKNEMYTLSLKLSKKQLFVLWTHDQRDQAGGKT
jgi:hypothetical protein